MNILKIPSEAIEGSLSGGVDEATSEGINETAEEATGREF